MRISPREIIISHLDISRDTRIVFILWLNVSLRLKILTGRIKVQTYTNRRAQPAGVLAPGSVVNSPPGWFKHHVEVARFCLTGRKASRPCRDKLWHPLLPQNFQPAWPGLKAGF